MTRFPSRFLAVLVLAAASSSAGAGDVVAVVSARSLITALSSEQLSDIFLGRANRFPDGTPAVPIDLDEDSPARERFYVQFTGKSAAQVKAHWSKIIFTGRGQPPRQAGSGAEARRLIAENPRAVGYIESTAVDASVRVLATR